MSRKRLIAAAAVLACAAAATTALTTAGGEGTAADRTLAEGRLASVERRTLVDYDTESGTLGYAGSAQVLARVSGTVTWLPRVGTTVRPGQRLLAVDGRPVYLMDGRVPAWRTLRSGVRSGDDVRQLEANLRALGFDPYGAITVDSRFTDATAAAVKRWQRARGARQTGRVELGEVVFLPGTRRIAKREVAVGGVIGGGGEGAGTAGSGGAPTPVLHTTTTRRVVSLKLDADKSSLARRGARVSVTLPDGREVRGRVSSVGTVAETESSGGGEEGGSSRTVIPVQVRLDRRARAPRLDAAPVSVAFARERRRSVLTVPVTALVALEGGRYGLEVVDGDARRTLRVTPGLFAQGYVEVEGRGLREGMRVVSGE